MTIIPNFFIIGASKCGTTSLYNMLAVQDSCCMSSIKEPSYFNDSTKNIEWYLSLFEKCVGNIAVGEASPIYAESTYFPEIPKKIYDFNPASKIIFIVRHPYDRLKSVWKQTLFTGHFYQKKYYHKRMPLNFEKAVFNYPPFLDACKYWTHIHSYKKFFDDSNIKVLYFEEYIKNISEIMNEVNTFLGLGPFQESLLDSKQKNSSKGKNIFNPVTLFLSKIPGYEQVKDIIPEQLKNALKQKMVIPVPSNPHISEKSKSKIREILSDDLRLLFDYTDKPADYWVL